MAEGDQGSSCDGGREEGNKLRIGENVYRTQKGLHSHGGRRGEGTRESPQR